MLKSYGQWMQYSVFECADLTETQYAKLRSRLNKVIKPKEDSILFFPLCACCQVDTPRTEVAGILGSISRTYLCLAATFIVEIGLSPSVYFGVPHRI